jgi:hypothetical protein
MNKDDKESLLNEILRKLSIKENFKNYFAMKYAEGSFIDFQNKLFNNEAFLYEVGRELFEIESQISNYTDYPEESKISQPIVQNTNTTSHSLRNHLTRRSFQKKEELSKTQTSQGFQSKDRGNVRASSNKHSNLKKNETKMANENNYLEPINFEKLLRNNQKKTPITVTKKPFNRFINSSIDKRRNLNKSGEILNRSKSREYFDNKQQQSINI